MSKFSKDNKKELPAISTASLPDIIFILLFFFMVVTVMRDKTIMVKQKLPSASEITKLNRKSLVAFINVGPPTEKYEKQFGTTPMIQLDDYFALDGPAEVGPFIEQFRTTKAENEIGAITASLKVDKEVKMGIITDIKQELRKVGQLKLNYSTIPKAAK